MNVRVDSKFIQGCKLFTPGLAFLVCLLVFQPTQLLAVPKVRLNVEMSVYVEAPHKIAFDELKKAYEKKNPNVEIVYLGAAYENFWDKLMTEIIAGTEGDIIQMQGDAQRYASYAGLRKGPTGAFVNLDSYIKGTHWEEDLASQKLMTYKGHYIGISNYSWGLRCFMYSKSLYEEAGIDANSIKNMVDFLSAAIKLTRIPEQYGFGAVLTSMSFVAKEWWVVLAKPVGNGLYFPEGKPPYTADRIQINSEPIVWAARVWQDWIHNYKISPSGKDKTGIRELFWNKAVATHIDGPWFLGMTNAYAPALLEDIGVYPTPAVIYKGKIYRQRALTYALSHLISTNCKVKEEAWKFLEWMATPEGQKLVALCGMIPSNKHYASSREFTESGPIARVNARIAQFAEEYFPPMPDPNIPQMMALRRRLVEAGQSMFILGEDVKETLGRVAEEMEEIMSR